MGVNDRYVISYTLDSRSVHDYSTSHLTSVGTSGPLPCLVVNIPRLASLKYLHLAEKQEKLVMIQIANIDDYYEND